MYSGVVSSHNSRKRPRQNDEENHKFMPSSKKFIESHVRHIFPDASSSSTDAISEMHNPNIFSDTDVTMLDIQRPTIRTDYGTTIHNRYRPEMSLIQNPFYYHVNGILHDAHMQRLFRLSTLNI